MGQILARQPIWSSPLFPQLQGRKNLYSRAIKSCGHSLAKTAFIKPSTPSYNDYCESFTPKLRDEPLIGEIVYSLAELK